MRKIHLWQISLSASAVIIRRCRMQNRKFSLKQFVKTRRMRTLKLEQKTGREMEEILAGSGASPLTFTDTQDPIVSMLSALGVVNGKGNGLFDPQADITREEAAVMLWRLAQQLGTVEP